MGKKNEVSKADTKITIRVIPRAKKSEISQVLDDGTIKIRLTAPPVEGKANQALVRFLADVFGISSSRIEIISGLKGRKKVVLLEGINEKTARSMIEEQIM
jgi:uncharacterized protein (TIGR00251 family)